jgi:predicted transcriptional regulator
MATSVLSFRVDPECISQLDALAAATDRDRQYHLKRAIARYLETELWQVRAIQEGIENAEAGRLTALDEIKHQWMTRAGALSDANNER